VPGFLFDTNVWLGLTFQSHPLHAAADAALANATVTLPAHFCRATQQSVLRLTSDARLARQYGVAPISNRDAFQRLEAFMGLPIIRFIEEPAGLLPRWKIFADLPTASPKRWMDAYLAAFAVEAGLTFVTGDNDFKVFHPTLSLVSLPSGGS
jgi:toxin-antitoxin system PIN domain toxin